MNRYRKETSPMARETLDRKLRHLLDEILVLDSMVEMALIESVEALKKRDLELARRVYAGDAQINAKRFEMENEIIITIATTQPVMAGDLRLVASILEVVGELERIGDYAKGIARIVLRLGNQPPVKPLIDIPRMVEIAVDMLHRAISAFIDQDIEQAQRIPAEDDQVDALYNQIYRELVAIMFSDPSTIDRANYLMWVAHNLERVADRVTNICERTVYSASGKLIEFAPTDDEAIERF
jgi:phosphate transport system protein